MEPLSNLDTNGAEESVIVSEVSSFQRLKRGTWGGKRCPVLPQFRSVLVEREVPLYMYASLISLCDLEVYSTYV